MITFGTMYPKIKQDPYIPSNWVTLEGKPFHGQFFTRDAFDMTEVYQCGQIRSRECTGTRKSYETFDEEGRSHTYDRPQFLEMEFSGDPWNNTRVICTKQSIYWHGTIRKRTTVKTYVDKTETKIELFDARGKHHSFRDQPSVTTRTVNLDGTTDYVMNWHSHGSLHREGKPALMSRGWFTHEKIHYLNGKAQFDAAQPSHRSISPAFDCTCHPMDDCDCMQDTPHDKTKEMARTQCAHTYRGRKRAHTKNQQAREKKKQAHKNGRTKACKKTRKAKHKDW